MRNDRLLRAAAALTAVALAVLFLQHQTQERERRALVAFASELSSFTVSDLKLRQELMSSRIGLSKHYDDLNDAIASTEKSAARLISLATRNKTLVAPASGLAMLVRDRSDALEDFKSGNALLQNALARLSAFDDEAISSRDRRLLTTVLRLTLDTSEDAVAEAQRSAARLSERDDDAAAAQARLLVKVLPEIDAVLRQVESDVIDDDLRRIVNVIETRSAQLAAARVRHSTLAGLMLASFAASVVSIAWRNFDRSRLRREQSRAAKLSARVAEILISNEEISNERRYISALAEVGRHMGATKVLLSAGAGDEARHIIWRRAEDQPGLKGEGAPRARSPAMTAVEPGSPRALDLRHRDWPELLLRIERNESVRRKGENGSLGGLAALSTIGRALSADRAQAARIALERRLAKAERLQVVGTIASGVAHNFNNIVGAISGFTEMARGRVRRGSAVAGYMDEISTSVERARALIDEILGLAGRGQCSSERVAVTKLLAETAALVRAARADGDRIVVQAVDEQVVVGSAGQLQQALVNIVNNALDSRASRVVTIAAEPRRLTSPLALSHGHVAAGSWSVLSVSDHGPGIPQSALPRLFEPFFTTRPAGNGLGLSTAWQTVSDHGGLINVLQPRAGGSIFEIWLPFVGTDRTGGGERIALIVEGQRADEYEDGLAKLGFEPVHLTPTDDFASVDATIVIAQSQDLRPRVLELRRSNIPVILATTSDQMEDWIGVANQVLLLPLKPDELALALNSALSPRHALADQADTG